LHTSFLLHSIAPSYYAMRYWMREHDNWPWQYRTPKNILHFSGSNHNFRALVIIIRAPGYFSVHPHATGQVRGNTPMPCLIAPTHALFVRHPSCPRSHRRIQANLLTEIMFETQNKWGWHRPSHLNWCQPPFGVGNVSTKVYTKLQVFMCVIAMRHNRAPHAAGHDRSAHPPNNQRSQHKLVQYKSRFQVELSTKSTLPVSMHTARFRHSCLIWQSIAFYRGLPCRGLQAACFQPTEFQCPGKS
jgi:hypothetical protein